MNITNRFKNRLLLKLPILKYVESIAGDSAWNESPLHETLTGMEFHISLN